MNDNKICIICCGKQKNKLNNLRTPEGYEIEIRNIPNELNIAKAYNEIINTSEAKYKIYLKKDIFISNENILRDIINIFSSNNKIGMIGIVGSETIPTSGDWLDSINKVGKYIHKGSKNNVVVHKNVEEEYKVVKVIDGMFMATQYDIKWREDLFEGKYFYDSSQCIEFIKVGYEIVVPKQVETWCRLSGKKNIILTEYEVNKEKFLNEYSKDIFPLVSILIPAYNRPELFKLAIESAINQTYKNIEIVVGDDSNNDDVKNIIRTYLEKYKKIKYFNNGGPLGDYGVKNCLKCFELSTGEYVNYLMDDDIFHKDKINKMINYFIEDNKISLVTSYRKLIDGYGNEIKDTKLNKKLVNKTAKFNGEKLMKMAFNTMTNIIGEPTTVLFRKSDVMKNGFGKYCNKQYITIIDLATWVNLLQMGDAVYISEPLSYFRIHDGQNENKPELIIRGATEWFELICDYCKSSKTLNYKKYFMNWIHLFFYVLSVLNKSANPNELKTNVLYDCYDKAMNICLED